MQPPEKKDPEKRTPETQTPPVIFAPADAEFFRVTDPQDVASVRGLTDRLCGFEAGDVLVLTPDAEGRCLAAEAGSPLRVCGRVVGVLYGRRGWE